MHLARRCADLTRLAIASLLCSLAVSQAPPRTPAAPPTFAAVALAASQQSYSMVEQRRFRDSQGNVVSVREKLDVFANGSDSPDYQLAFLGVVGEPLKSPLNVEWQQIYQRYGRMFVDHGSFRISDLGKVQQNYSLHHFGTVIRAGRVAFREVVFPATADKSTWLIDVDATTYVPLYQVEFDSQFRMLAEIEAESFTQSSTGAPSGGVTPVVAGGSSPAAVVHADFATAHAFLGNPQGLVDPGVNLANGYVLDRVFTRDDPLNGQQKLVGVYTDGVDQFLVVQMPGTPDVFAALGSAKDGGAGNIIGRYRDPALSVLVFWEEDVLFHVAGRGAMHRLDEVAKHLYLQALTTH